jgi:hypothetical protein
VEIKQLSKAQLRGELSDPASMDLINRWFERGDGCAVYQNVALDSKGAGHKLFLSYGSPAAQLETPEAPERMPDIGGYFGWKYRLIATCRPAVEVSGE